MKKKKLLNLAIKKIKIKVKMGNKNENSIHNLKFSIPIHVYLKTKIKKPN